jgi:NAD dependent epimerase/dehydratase family enzyme
MWFSGGGSGFVGTALGQLLWSKGYGVTLVSRMPGPQRMSWVTIANTGSSLHSLHSCKMRSYQLRSLILKMTQ